MDVQRMDEDQLWGERGFLLRESKSQLANARVHLDQAVWLKSQIDLIDKKLGIQDPWWLRVKSWLNERIVSPWK